MGASMTQLSFIDGKSPQAVREAAIQYRGALPAGERPANRIFAYGAGALSTPELLSIILGGNATAALVDAERLLQVFDGLPGLILATKAEIEAEPGMGPAKVAAIKAAFELGRRLLVAAPHERHTVRSPADAANLLMAEMSLLEQEHLKTILLDTRNHVLAVETVYIGSVNCAQVRVAEVFRMALRKNAVAMIVAHNHPTGDPSASPEDVQMTRLIVEAGALLGIDILDHVIIGRQRFVSMKERGLGFK
jgi:DNA repair protein RadC